MAQNTMIHDTNDVNLFLFHDMTFLPYMMEEGGFSFSPMIQNTLEF